VLGAALALAARGLHVFPCKPRSKHPATPHGLLDATCDTGTIEAWWRSEPRLNVAVRTGSVSNVIVIDADGGEAETVLLQLELQHGALPASVETITARGRHIWFSHPGYNVPNSAGRIAPHIDVRGDGGFVLCPPSVHPSGRRYCWSVDSAAAIAAAPRWLLDLLMPTATRPAAASAEWRNLIGHTIPEGRRNDSLTRLTGYLLRRRVDPSITRELLHSFNVTHCEPPLPGKDVERIVSSICGREPKKREAGND
jgi:hypothetical protein